MDGGAKLIACSCPAFSCSFVSAAHSESNGHLCGFSDANCFITGPSAEGIWTRIVLKNMPAMQEMQVRSLGWEDPLKKEWQPTPVFLPGKFHGQRSLKGYSPKGCKELDMPEHRTQQHNTVFRHSSELPTLSLLPS